MIAKPNRKLAKTAKSKPEKRARRAALARHAWRNTSGDSYLILYYLLLNKVDDTHSSLINWSGNINPWVC